MNAIRLPWRGESVPYALVDVIRGCNCVCRTCYNRVSPRAKPLSEISRELDVIFASRRVEFVGIIGGEPLLHPDIVGIVKMISLRGVRSVLMTNGVLWSDGVARDLAAAGLAMVYFHIQAGQRRPDVPGEATQTDVERLALEKTSIAAAAGIDSAVSSTVRATDSEMIAEVTSAFRRNRFSSHAFLTLERNMDTIDSGIERFGAVNSIETLSSVLRPLGWRPFAFNGGKVDPSRPRWVVYHSYQRVDADGDETGFVTLTPSLLEKAVFALMNLFGRRIPVRTDPSRCVVLIRIALNAVSGGRFMNLPFVFSTIFRGERLLRKNIIAEAFPDLMPDGGIEYCDPCMDPVVKNGRLVPVCLVDTEFAKGVRL